MPSDIGWLLDVSVRGNSAVIWVKSEDGRAIKLFDEYHPTLHILPKGEEERGRLFRMLSDSPNVRSIEQVTKKINLRGDGANLIHIEVEDTFAFRNLVRALSTSDLVKELFDTDLLHVQRFLFGSLKVEPTSKVEVVHSDSRLESMRKIDDSDKIEPPPFSTLYFDLHQSSESLTPDPNTDPIASIEISFQGEETILSNSETELVEEFSKFIQRLDPDFLVTPNCDLVTFPYLLQRCRINKLNPTLGRDHVDCMDLNRPLPYWIPGRISLDYGYYGFTQEEWGIAGLVERTRFAFLPPGIAGRWTANRINDSRVCFELMERGYVIPRNTGYHEFVRRMDEVVERDRGGVIISHLIGQVHENIAELDYESQYPNIIVKEGLSFETVTPKGVVRTEDAILPAITKDVLRRRLHFKGLRASLPKDSKEWRWCEQRQNALKLVLVCIYGTSGCCWNRFGNVLTFEEINLKSREVMIRTKNLVQKMGYEVVYADTDSIFVKREGAKEEDYRELARLIGEHNGLPISLDHHYKFLLLLPLESDPSGIMEAQKHYFGKLMNGQLVNRGIEVRRHDTPRFIKDFQVRLILTLFDYEFVEEVRTKGYERAQELVTHALDDLMEGKIPVEDLVVTKILRRSVNKYRSIFPHVSAAIQLASRGKAIKEGEMIDFIFTDADHHNPLCRVAPYDSPEGRTSIDKEKYKDMILDAAETVLSTFGFTRDSYGFQRKFNRWIDEMWEERKAEIAMEIYAEE